MSILKFTGVHLRSSHGFNIDSMEICVKQIDRECIQVDVELNLNNSNNNVSLKFKFKIAN